MPAVVYVLLVFLLNLYFHRRPLRLPLTVLRVLVIAVAGTVVYQVLAYYAQGYLDPFYQIAAMVQVWLGTVAGAVAVSVKILYWYSRKEPFGADPK